MIEATAQNYRDVFYQSHDGLRLYARDYDHAGAQAATILCMPGLTRNSSDFAEICAVLEPHYRLLVAEQRGRGKSAWDSNTDNYNPLVYVQDMFTLLDELRLQNVILLGTSLGGLMAMMMAASQPERVSGLIINDIGPEVSPVGLARIKSYVGQLAPVKDWPDAVAQSKQLSSAAFPNYSDAQWQRFARKLFWENEHGIPVLAYDPAISESLNEDRDDQASASPDLWPLYAMLASKAILVIRGETSDILAKDCLQRMIELKPDLVSVEVPGVGHAPMLDEPAAIAAIENFLSSEVRVG